MQAKTIDEVISILERIILESKSKESTMGYFAALYRKVTIKVKEGIVAGEFEDGKRMERLDVIFANRYLKAYYDYSEDSKVSTCWKIAFQNASNPKLIVLQHLLLGMNAHINLDLSIAAAESTDNMSSLKKDFNKINEILNSLVSEVEEELSSIWPTLKYLLRFAGKIDDFLVGFSMKIARKGAWKFANELSVLKHEAWNSVIIERDLKITKRANIVINPGFIVRQFLRLIRLFEKGTVADRIEILR